MTSLELAVRFGKTLIIQEMDGVEPVLYPLLRRDLVAQGIRTLTNHTLKQRSAGENESLCNPTQWLLAQKPTTRLGL